MKLKPFAVSVECPVCKGSGQRMKTPTQAATGEVWSSEAYNRGYVMVACETCSSTGKIAGPLLAPSSWDGKSEFEWPGDKCIALLYGCEVLERVCAAEVKAFANPEPGHCGDCKWYGSDQKCDNISVPFIRQSILVKDFGCTYHERKEG